MSCPAMDHELKTWPDPFDAILQGRKTFEWRKDDRGFEVGDTLRLLEYEPAEGRYTDRVIRAQVTYIARGPRFDIPEGYCVMAIKLL